MTNLFSLLLYKLQNVQLVPLTALFVSFASMAASWSSFLRDRGRLDVHVGTWKPHDWYESTPGPFYLRVQAVNSGRRPVVPKHLGCFPRGQRWRRWANLFLPHDFAVKVTPVQLYWPEVHAAFTLEDEDDKKNRLPRVFTEGESLTASMPILTTKAPTVAFWKTVREIYIEDSTGRLHFVPSGIVRALLAEIQKMDPKLVSSSVGRSA